MVEEATAAAHSLREETVVLADLIGKFRYGGSRTAPAPQSRSSPVHAPQRKAQAFAESRPGTIGATALKTETWEEF